MMSPNTWQTNHAIRNEYKSYLIETYEIVVCPFSYYLDIRITEWWQQPGCEDQDRFRIVSFAVNSVFVSEI